MVKKMISRTRNILAFASRNLRYGGIAFIIAAAYIMYAKPENLIIFLAPYTGSPLLLGKLMVLFGGFASILGLTLKRWLDCAPNN